MLDPEYFLLVEVNKDELEQKDAASKKDEENKIATVRSHVAVVDMRNITITLDKKVPLRSVESLIDRSEPRNLILGFVHSSKSQT
jgi:hypothetical protein